MAPGSGCPDFDALCSSPQGPGLWSYSNVMLAHGSVASAHESARILKITPITLPKTYKEMVVMLQWQLPTFFFF